MDNQDDAPPLTPAVGLAPLPVLVQDTIGRDVMRLFDVAMPPMSVLDRSANLLFSNESFRRLIGLDAANGAEATAENGNGRLAAFRAQIGEVLIEAETQGGALTTRIHLGGDDEPLSLTCMPLAAPAPQAAPAPRASQASSGGLFVALIDDVSLWLGRLDQARQADERLGDFLACSADWVWEVAADGGLVFASERLAALLGRPGAALLGRDLGELGRLADQDAELLSELGVFRARQPFRDLDFVIERPDGSTLTHLISGVPVFDRESGQFTGYRGSGTDISHQIATLERVHRSELRLSQALTTLRDKNEELERALVEARESSLSKGRFLAAMSHDLRTPLNAIIGFAEVLKSELHGPVGDRRYVDYADDIHVSALRLFKLIGEILDFSALQSNVLMLDRMSVRVDREAALAVQAFADRAEAAGVELVLKVDDQPLPVHGDEPALKRVLHALIDNAIKYTDRGGRVEVAVIGETTATRLVIRDTGHGIAPEALRRVDEAFERPNQSPMHAGQGLGLGLAICRRLIDHLKGSMTIDSQPGYGTVITVVLPADAPNRPALRRIAERR